MADLVGAALNLRVVFHTSHLVDSVARPQIHTLTLTINNKDLAAHLHRLALVGVEEVVFPHLVLLEAVLVINTHRLLMDFIRTDHHHLTIMADRRLFQWVVLVAPWVGVLLVR